MVPLPHDQIITRQGFLALGLWLVCLSQPGHYAAVQSRLSHPREAAQARDGSPGFGMPTDWAKARTLGSWKYRRSQRPPAAALWNDRVGWFNRWVLLPESAAPAAPAATPKEATNQRSLEGTPKRALRSRTFSLNAAPPVALTLATALFTLPLLTFVAQCRCRLQAPAWPAWCVWERWCGGAGSAASDAARLRRARRRGRAYSLICE